MNLSLLRYFTRGVLFLAALTTAGWLPMAAAQTAAPSTASTASANPADATATTPPKPFGPQDLDYNYSAWIYVGLGVVAIAILGYNEWNQRRLKAKTETTTEDDPS